MIRFVLLLLRKFIPFRILIRLIKEERTSRLLLDSRIFPECQSKIEPLWSWKKLRHEKVAVHFKEGKFITKKL